MTDEERQMQTTLAYLLGWREFHISGLSGLLWGIDAQGDQHPVPEWPTDLGAAVGLSFEILCENSAYSLSIYHESNESYDGPAVHLVDGNSPAGDYFGYSPPIMCDRHQDDRLAFAICDVLRNFLKELKTS